MSQFNRGVNKIPSFVPIVESVRRLQLPHEVVDEYGSVSIVYKEHVRSEYGTIEDYDPIVMAQAGIKPSSINTGHGSRLGASTEMAAFEAAADKILNKPE